MDGTVLLGLLEVIAIALVPLGIVAACMHARYLLSRFVDLGRRVSLLNTPDPPTAGPPLEWIASELRRLRPEVRSPRPELAVTVHRAIVAEYDGVLVQAATALGVPTTLAEVPEGLDHEAERLRLEHSLELAGLSWRVHRR